MAETSGETPPHALGRFRPDGGEYKVLIKTGIGCLALVTAIFASSPGHAALKASHVRAEPAPFALREFSLACDLRGTAGKRLHAGPASDSLDSTDDLGYRFEISDDAGGRWTSPWLAAPGAPGSWRIPSAVLRVAYLPDSISSITQITVAVYVKRGSTVSRSCQRHYYRRNDGLFHTTRERRRPARTLVEGSLGPPPTLPEPVTLPTQPETDSITRAKPARKMPWGQLKATYRPVAADGRAAQRTAAGS